MIRGRVNSKYEANISLLIYGVDGSERTFSALIDTGSSAELIVSDAEVDLLGLPYVDVIYMTQADDEEVIAWKYDGEVMWQGNRRRVDVICIGKSVVIGMGMMRTHRLNIDINVNGEVEID